MVLTKTKKVEICPHCGSTLIIPDDDGRSYCLSCGGSFSRWQDYGKRGGQETFFRHGREHYVMMGNKGGRPKWVRQVAPEANKSNGGKVTNGNSLSGLKELYKYKRGESAAANGSPQGGL